MTELQDRVRAIAAKPKAPTLLQRNLRREWWAVTLPSGDVLDVFFCPPRSQDEVIAEFYPGATVEASAK